ncbi:Transcription factor TFIIH subunit p52/Tfb2 [Phytophthora cactorum]|nr:Transcription factor TFIIH subunit p52/Tfb2 [Phytophthora cactorum]
MDAFDFLETLPTATLERLYQDPWACQAIFQALPPLAQQFVMRLLPTNAAVPRELLEQWVVPLPGETKRVPPQFHAALQNWRGFECFNLGGSPWERGRLHLPRTWRTRSLRWIWSDMRGHVGLGAALHGGLYSCAGASPVRGGYFTRTRLLKLVGRLQGTAYYRHGLRVHVKDIHVQMWIFMLEYIRTLDNTGTLKQEDILQFLFQISYCQTGGLAVNLIFGGSTGQKRSHVSLTSSFAGVRAGMKSQVADPRQAPTVDHGAQLLVVVETNFKIYAYTSSTLHVAMLSVFVDIVARLPNLAIGFITRESLRSALIHGISAQQIYDFLMKHAHPKMRHNTPVIPENIADQIYLWERERNRVQFLEGILFDGFNTKEDYESVRDYAKSLKVLTWSDPIHFRLSIATAGVDDVRHYIQNQLSSRG